MATFSLSPASQSVAAGAPATITIHWAAGGVTGDFSFDDGGVGGTFVPASLTGSSDGVTFTYTGGSPGTVTVTVTGVGGSLGGVAETCDVTIIGSVQIETVYSLVSATTGTQSAIPNFENSGGVVSSATGAGSVCIRMDMGFARNVTNITGAVAFSYTPTEIWEWSTDDITYHTFTPTLAVAYSPGGGVYSEVDQVWTPTSTITARFFRYTMTDTGSGSQVATPGVITLAANAPTGGSSGGTLSLSGTITRFGGPYASGPVSIVYKTGTGFSIRVWHVGNQSTNGMYCADGDMLVDVVTTDCSGNWAWSGPANVRSVQVFLGPMRINPNFNAESSALDIFGVRNSTYISIDPTFPEFALAARNIRDVSSTSGTRSGTLTTLAVTGTPTSATDAKGTSGNCCGAGVGTNGAETAIGFTLGGAFQGYSASSPCNSFTYLVGSYTLNNALGAENMKVWLGIKGPGGILYNLTDQGGAAATLTDSCGNTGPITFPGQPFALAPEAIEWWLINSVTGVTSNGGFNCSNLQTLSTVPAHAIQISPVNQLHSPVETDRLFGAKPDGLLIIVRDCTTNTPGVQMQADTFDGALNVAWVSSGALKTAVHLGAQLQIGSSTTGWQATQTVEASNVSAVGLFYMPNGRLVMPYSLSNVSKRRTNDRRGTGVAGDWSAAANFTVGQTSAVGRGQQQSWVLGAGSSDQAGKITLYQARDGAGAALTSGVTVLGGTTKGPLCGGVWLGNQYGVLYTRFSDAEVLWIASATPDSWTGLTPVDTTFAGSVCGLVRHPSGRLVGLTQASAAGAVHALISNDSGKTWTQSSAIGITPTIPPVIVCIGAVLYAVYIASDAPHFVASTDGGVTFS